MSDKKTTLVLFAYDDGSSEYAVGAHAQEVKDWINAGQSMLFAHGSTYTGRKMVFVPADDKKRNDMSFEMLVCHECRN